MRLRCADAVYEVELHPANRDWDVRVNGEVLRLSLADAAEGRVAVRHGGEVLTLYYARDGGAIHLFWEGVSYKLLEEREGVRRAARHDAGALEAPMPGRVSAVKVEVGAHVRKGEELLVVEAMKMENALRAPRDGVVRAVHVGVGEMVAPGRALVEIEDEGERT
jgi:3-methylcrotonyl-CoA carboxylase alpha subunit